MIQKLAGLDRFLILLLLSCTCFSLSFRFCNKTDSIVLLYFAVLSNLYALELNNKRWDLRVDKQLKDIMQWCSTIFRYSISTPFSWNHNALMPRKFVTCLLYLSCQDVLLLMSSVSRTIHTRLKNKNVLTSESNPKPILPSQIYKICFQLH